MTAPERVRLRIRIDESGCWIYLGARVRKGYGQVWNGERVVPAHRAMLEEKLGRHLRDDEQADHVCGVPPCVNPGHLRPASAKENVENYQRSSRAASGHRGVTRANRGKPWMARAMSNGISHYLGQFDTPEEAAEAARQARLQLHTRNDRDREKRKVNG